MSQGFCGLLRGKESAPAGLVRAQGGLLGSLRLILQQFFHRNADQTGHTQRPPRRYSITPPLDALAADPQIAGKLGLTGAVALDYFGFG